MWKCVYLLVLALVLGAAYSEEDGALVSKMERIAALWCLVEEKRPLSEWDDINEMIIGCCLIDETSVPHVSFNPEYEKRSSALVAAIDEAIDIMRLNGWMIHNRKPHAQRVLLEAPGRILEIRGHIDEKLFKGEVLSSYEEWILSQRDQLVQLSGMDALIVWDLYLAHLLLLADFAVVPKWLKE